MCPAIPPARTATAGHSWLTTAKSAAAAATASPSSRSTCLAMRWLVSAYRRRPCAGVGENREAAQGGPAARAGGSGGRHGGSWACSRRVPGDPAEALRQASRPQEQLARQSAQLPAGGRTAAALRAAPLALPAMEEAVRYGDPAGKAARQPEALRRGRRCWWAAVAESGKAMATEAGLQPAAMPACCCTVACPAAACRPPPLLLRAAVRARGLSASGSWLKRPIRPLVPACCW